MVKKKRTKRIQLGEIPTKGFPPQSVPPGYAPNNNQLAPNTRPDPNTPVNPRTGRIPEAQTPFPAAYGATASGPAGNTIPGTKVPGIPGDSGADSDAGAFESGAKISLSQIGNSGTQIFGGYFSEEYLHELRGRRGAFKWDEMRRSEAQISMLINAMTNPIKAANWGFEAADESNPDYVRHKELIEMIITKMIDFETLKHEALTMVPFGFTIFETIHNVTYDHPKFGTFNGLKALAFRSQKTIENWQLEQQTGRLLGVNQYTYSDLGGNQFIPGDFLLVLTHSKEGDNYEGISVLRPMLGAYKRKELYLKLAAIGIERYAIGTPIGTVPKGKEKSAEYEEFLTVLQNYTSHESSFITVPEGWKIDIQKGDFDADKIKELLIFENTEFANAVVANFLALGMNGGGGAYALGSNLGEFFTTGIQSYADVICSCFNRSLIPNLVKLNYGEQAAYPTMKVTGISDKAGKDLAETIKFLTDSRVLDPDKPIKEWLRKQYKMPKPDVNSATALPAIPAGASANYPKPNDPVVNPITNKIEPFQPNQLVGDGAKPQKSASGVALSEANIKLADPKAAAKFDKNKARLKIAMQSSLSDLYDGLRAALKTKYNSLSGSNKILAAKGLETPGLNAYKAVLRDQLAMIAAQSIADARRMVPAAKNVKLSDTFDALSPAVRNLINAQAGIIADTQSADIEKIVSFSFTKSATSSDNVDDILNDVDESVLPSLDGSTGEGMSLDAAAGDAVAHVGSAAAMSFFMDPEVADSIESFTFTNEDPVSDICIEMNGTTCAVGDPTLDDYATPLHHNCKSRWVPNLKGDDNNPDIGSGDAQANGGLSLTKKALKSMTLSELTSKGRKHISPENFAVPSEKKFPIHDISHARNALARASGTKYEAQVKAAVYAKYPSLKG